MATAFDSLSLCPALLSVIEELGFIEATPVQQEAIPMLLAGNDLIAQSRTGSGKTLAFAAPLLQQLVLDPTSTADPAGDLGL